MCLKLAEKVSICLDFAKTGRLTDLEPGERAKKYPDFMEKQDHKPSYWCVAMPSIKNSVPYNVDELGSAVSLVIAVMAAVLSSSKKVLGKLYRTCRSLENTASMTPIECDTKYFNAFFRLDGWEAMKTKAITFVQSYQQRLTKIMERMGIKSEAEIMVSVVNQVGKYQSNSFHEVEELQEQLERQVTELDGLLVFVIPSAPSEEPQSARWGFKYVQMFYFTARISL